MLSSEFKTYMDRQILEIEKFKESQAGLNSNLDENECVFEWIKKNARDFRRNWKR